MKINHIAMPVNMNSNNLQFTGNNIRKNINFTSNENHKSHQKPSQKSTQKAAIIIVALLGGNLIGQQAIRSCSEDSNDGAIIENIGKTTSPNLAETDSNYINRIINTRTTQFKKDFKLNNENYTMYFIDRNKDFGSDSRNVTDIYFVPTNYKQENNVFGSPKNMPPKLNSFTYHEFNISQKDYVEANIITGLSNGGCKKENIKLPAKVANEILKLVTRTGEFEPSRKLEENWNYQ